MSNTLKFGDGKWAVKEGSTLAYNDENGNYKPLPFTFDRAGSATRVNKEGLIEVVSNNEPRIDFLNDSKGALLLEPSRSNRFSNTDLNEWSKSGSVSLSETISPSGKNDAYEFAGTGNINLFTSLTSTGTHIFSIYAKGNVGDSFRVYKSNGFSYAQNTITIDTTEWKRYYFTRDFSSTNGIIFIDSFGDDNISLYAPQLEQGSYPTSYIPTSGATATRNAETSSKANISNLINSSEGVLYFEAKVNAQDTFSGFSLSDNTTNNEIIVRFTTQDRIEYYLRSSGTQPIALTTTAFDTDEYVKVAFAYKSGDSAFYVNGTQVTTSTTTTMPVSLSNLKFSRGNGTGVFDGKTKDLRVYNTRLSNTELAELTKI